MNFKTSGIPILSVSLKFNLLQRVIFFLKKIKSPCA